MGTFRDLNENTTHLTVVKSSVLIYVGPKGEWKTVEKRVKRAQDIYQRVLKSAKAERKGYFPRSNEEVSFEEEEEEEEKKEKHKCGVQGEGEGEGGGAGEGEELEQPERGSPEAGPPGAHGRPGVPLR